MENMMIESNKKEQRSPNFFLIVTIKGFIR